MHCHVSPCVTMRRHVSPCAATCCHMLAHRCARALSALCQQSIFVVCIVCSASRPRCLPSDPTCTGVGHRPCASIGEETLCMFGRPYMCLRGIRLPWSALTEARSWLPTHERSLPPIKSLFSLFHYVLRRHQGMLRRYNAPVTLLPLDFALYCFLVEAPRLQPT